MPMMSRVPTGRYWDSQELPPEVKICGPSTRSRQYCIISISHSRSNPEGATQTAVQLQTQRLEWWSTKTLREHGRGFTMRDAKGRQKRLPAVRRGFYRSRHEVDFGAVAYELVVPVHTRTLAPLATEADQLDRRVLQEGVLTVRSA